MFYSTFAKYSNSTITELEFYRAFFFYLNSFELPNSLQLYKHFNSFTGIFQRSIWRRSLHWFSQPTFWWKSGSSWEEIQNVMIICLSAWWDRMLNEEFNRWKVRYEGSCVTATSSCFSNLFLCSTGLNITRVIKKNLFSSAMLWCREAAGNVMVMGEIWFTGISITWLFTAQLHSYWGLYSLYRFYIGRTEAPLVRYPELKMRQLLPKALATQEFC